MNRWLAYINVAAQVVMALSLAYIALNLLLLDKVMSDMVK